MPIRRQSRAHIFFHIFFATARAQSHTDLNAPPHLFIKSLKVTTFSFTFSKTFERWFPHSLLFVR
jgi:hypothetical protein